MDSEEMGPGLEPLNFDTGGTFFFRVTILPSETMQYSSIVFCLGRKNNRNYVNIISYSAS